MHGPPAPITLSENYNLLAIIVFDSNGGFDRDSVVLVATVKYAHIEPFLVMV
jgi:hypothetical protein